ncbi:MAG: IPExxxVDY family protein [Bacteroidota bacterium]|jgi:hypothetical protein
MSKFTLESDFSYDFTLFGISCHETEYRLCFMLNRELGFNFVRERSLEINSKKLKQTFGFSIFSSEDTQTLEKIYLICNYNKNVKSEPLVTSGVFQSGLFDNAPEFAQARTLLIPEKPDIDFFLLLPLSFSESFISSIQEKLNKLENILSCVEINPDSLDSKINLLF